MIKEARVNKKNQIFIGAKSDEEGERQRDKEEKRERENIKWIS